MADPTRMGRTLEGHQGLARHFSETADTWEGWREDGHAEWRLARFLDDMRRMAEMLARRHARREAKQQTEVSTDAAADVPDGRPDRP